jgi:D-arabinose 1-dehydrogenase-like Zn-dependent alcohol dehydrogenase
MFTLLTGEVGLMPFPIVLGHQGVGRIEKLGEIETDYAGMPVRPGDAICGRHFRLQC